MTVTFAYFTSRKNCLIENFYASLSRQLENFPHAFKVVVIDFWAQEMPGWTESDVAARHAFITSDITKNLPVTHVPPKPNPWQGKYRLTSQDWWAASTARNTAICLAPDGWIVFSDDLSVFLPGYVDRVKAAIECEGKVTCGAYRKVKKLVVKNGVVESFEEDPAGHDNRYGYGRDNEAVPCEGNWLYGCSLVAPVEAFLSIGGFPEAWTDSLSFEDVLAGIMLAKKGWKLQYDRSLMTYESQEGHAEGPVMRREDIGQSPNDLSHHVLRAAQNCDGFHPNYFGEEGIRGLRNRVLNGEPFPILQIPEHHFYSGKPLREL